MLIHSTTHQIKQGLTVDISLLIKISSTKMKGKKKSRMSSQITYYEMHK